MGIANIILMIAIVMIFLVGLYAILDGGYQLYKLDKEEVKREAEIEQRRKNK